MKKTLLIFMLAGALSFALSSCNDSLQDDVDQLSDRLTAVENTVKELDAAIKSGKLISSWDAIAATADKPAGWKITFSNGAFINLYNGTNGTNGETPYMWINSRGNWATTFGSKPADSDATKYELLVGGQPVKARGDKGDKGISIRVVNVNGYVAFQTYDPTTNTIIETVKTTFPFDGGKIITSITETEQSVTFTIDGKNYLLAKAEVYPTALTVIANRKYIKKEGTVEFDVAVSPSSAKLYAQAAFGLHLDYGYFNTRSTYGDAPDFLKIKSVTAAEDQVTYPGQYHVTLEWVKNEDSFKDAPIFLTLRYTDAQGKEAFVVSSTPVIFNEEYVTIKNENLNQPSDVVMFSDETYTDLLVLNNYSLGYVGQINYTLTANPTSTPQVLNAVTKDADSLLKYTLTPKNSDINVWPAEMKVRRTIVEAAVTDTGKAAIPAVPANPAIGQPGVDGVPAIVPVTVKKNFNVTVYKANDIIYTKSFGDRWIPNSTVNYILSEALSSQFVANGYTAEGWNIVIKSQKFTKNGTQLAMDNNITADTNNFTSNYTVAYKLLPTIAAGSYTVELTFTATAKQPRLKGLKQTREFGVKLNFNVVAPKFKVEYNGGHSLFSGNTYFTTTLNNVNITTLFNVESTKNISAATDVVPNVAPLSYDFDTTIARQGAQGIRFTPYPSVIAPVLADWGNAMTISKSIYACVKLVSGQEIPVQIWCTYGSGEMHSSNGIIYVNYVRRNLSLVTANTASFYGNYNTMINTGISIAVNNNFTPRNAQNETLDPTSIKSIVYSSVGTVQCTGTLPNGLAGRNILQINSSTGVVTSIDGITWENPEAVLYQSFRVTYTDIWNNSASKDVIVFFKSNGTPTL